MARARKHKKTTDQGELFVRDGFFPLRAPARESGPVDLSLRIKRAMSRALRECPDTAVIVAARIAELTGRPLSDDALYTYTAASKPEHDMGIVRFVAFVRATGAKWLWDEVLRDDGLLVLEGAEAKLAQLGHLQQLENDISAKRQRLEEELKQAPVQVRPRNKGASQ